MLNVTTFQYHNSKTHRVRTIQNKDESIWFVNVDVCKILNIKNPRYAITILADDEKGVVKADTPGGKQKLIIISESGLYTLIMRSNKPAAKKFRKWVTSEVLPQIRQTGSYIPDVPADVPETPPQIRPQAITAFLQATTDTFWRIEKALNEYSLAETNLKQARRDVSIIIRSIHNAFPECRGTVDLLGNISKPPLEVELR